MENFLKLPAEKQNAVIDAALAVFAANGYKKASAADIAAAAGISKPMVFHYFGTKKKLYLYLVGYCRRAVLDELEQQFDENVSDFFDRILLYSDIKLAMMRKHPAILAFLTSAYYEKDENVMRETQEILTGGEAEKFREKILLSGIDASKFKAGVDPGVVMKMLVFFSYGAARIPPDGSLDLDSIYRDFKEILELLKKNLYKPEAL